MMRYISHDESIGFSSLKCLETETPKNDPDTEVLIKIEATGVNRADLNQVSYFFNLFWKSFGTIAPPLGVTNILGLECAGYLVDPVTN